MGDRPVARPRVPAGRQVGVAGRGVGVAGRGVGVADRRVGVGSRRGGGDALGQAAQRGEALAPVWFAYAEALRSDDLRLVAAAWSLCDTLGSPLAPTVATVSHVVRRRRSVRQRIAAALAGPRATMRVLTALPLSGPFVAIAVGVSPGRPLHGNGRSHVARRRSRRAPPRSTVGRPDDPGRHRRVAPSGAARSSWPPPMERGAEIRVVVTPRLTVALALLLAAAILLLVARRRRERDVAAAISAFFPRDRPSSLVGGPAPLRERSRGRTVAPSRAPSRSGADVRGGRGIDGPPGRRAPVRMWCRRRDRARRAGGSAGTRGRARRGGGGAEVGPGRGVGVGRGGPPVVARRHGHATGAGGRRGACRRCSSRVPTALRSNRLAAIDVAAARLGVRLVVPLGVAFLPAFVLTTIVPVVLALARQVLAS